MKFNKILEISLENLQSFGRVYFTPKQLFYEFCRVSRFPFAVDLKKFAPVLGKISNLVRNPNTLEPPITWEEFEAEFENYRQNRRLEGLLQIESEIGFPAEFPPDLMLYGLPKVLICETDEIAQMLRANQFHLQTPCAVLSLPEASPFPEIWRKMLDRAENPQVYFLHNASLPAYSVLQNLRQTLELKAEIPLRPLGIRPIHAMRLQLFAHRSVSRDFDLSDFVFLSDDEKKWLKDGRSAEVSSVSPMRLLRVLRRLILDLEIPASNWPLKLPKKNLGFM